MNDQEVADILKLAKKANVIIRVGKKIKTQDKRTGADVSEKELQWRLR